MINHRKTILRLTVIVLAVAGPVKRAHAQAAPPASPGTNVPPPDVLPDLPAGEAGGPPPEEPEGTNLGPAAQPPPGMAPVVNLPPLVFPSVAPGVIQRRRVKPLQLGVGLDPTAPDFGAEADMVSTANEGTANVKPKRWTFVAHGFVRAPFRLSIGDSSPSVTNGMTTSNELHSPPHVVGASIDDWNSVGLLPAPVGGLYLSVGNAIVSGTLIISAGTFFDSGYKRLDQMGGISQGYVTMKFNDAFGNRGGLALTAGAFSNRYGLAGPHQNSSGYYNTYLFGRTRVAGEALTADIDLTEHLELVIEDGFGSKLEVVPWLYKPVNTPYLPDQGPTPQGSNFVHHAHAALLMDDWLSVTGHFLTSWSPNDLSASTGGLSNVQSSKMNVFGGEVHVDSSRFGNGYFGYSRVDATRVISLADGIQVIHATNGTGLTRNYLNPAFTYRAVPIGTTLGAADIPAPGSVGDSGTIDTVLFQYMLRLAPLLEWPATGRDLSLAVYGMFNHVQADMLPGGGKQDKLKLGAEAEFAALRYLSVGARFDRVMPNGSNSDVAYTAISPRLIIHSSWLSREYILLDYTRYFLGSLPQLMTTAYDPVLYAADKNLLVLSALISF